MKNFLQTKGFEFQDERLNACINLAASSVFGRQKIKFLLKYLTPECVEVINTKQFVTNIPGNNDVKIECGLVPQENDPACVDTIVGITIIQPNGIRCGFEFNIGKFHKNMHECDGEFFNYIESSKTENSEEFLMKHDLSMSVLSMLDSTLLKPQGVYTNINDNYTFPVIKPLNVEKLFRGIGANLKTRDEYIKQDVETLKTVYPQMYEFYQTTWNKRHAQDKVASLKFLDEEFERVFDVLCVERKPDAKQTSKPKLNAKAVEMLLSIKTKALDISYRSTIDKTMDDRKMYHEWIRENNLAINETVDYADWVLQNTGIENVENLINGYTANVIEIDKSLNGTGRKGISETKNLHSKFAPSSQGVKSRKPIEDDFELTM